MKAFEMAVRQRAEEEESEETPPAEELIEFTIGEHEFTARRPTEGQVLVFVATGGLGGTQSLTAAFRFLRGVLDNGSYALLLSLVESGEIDSGLLIGGDDVNEEGIVEKLIEQASARPTGARSDSSSSSKTGGKKSTGRSPGKGSTLSE